MEAAQQPPELRPGGVESFELSRLAVVVLGLEHVDFAGSHASRECDLELLRFGGSEHAGGGSVVGHRVVDHAARQSLALLRCDDLVGQGLRLGLETESLDQPTESRLVLGRDVDTICQAQELLVVGLNRASCLVRVTIARPHRQRVDAQTEETEGAHVQTHDRHAEVGVDAFVGLLHLVQSELDRRLHQRQILGTATFRLEATQCRAAQGDPGKRIGIATVETTGLLEIAADKQQSHVRQETKSCGGPAETPVVGLGGGMHIGHADQTTTRDAVHARADDTSHDVTGPAEERVAELLGVVLLDGFDHPLGVGMAAHRTLTVDQEGPGHDVGAFHRDAHRDGLVEQTQDVVGTLHHASAAEDIHAVADDACRPVGAVCLEHARGDRGLDVVVDGGAQEHTRRLEDVGESGHASDALFDTFHLANGQTKLAAHHGVGTGGRGGHLHAADGTGRQRDAATASELFHQHAPAATGTVLAADDVVDADDHIATDQRTVLEATADGHVVVTVVEARRALMHQDGGDADVLALTQDVVRVDDLAGHGGDVGDRAERHVALLEVAAQHDGAIRVAEDMSGGLDALGVTAGGDFGETEAGHVGAVGQLGQVVGLLLRRAVVHEQLGGAQAVGDDHHRSHLAAVGHEHAHDGGDGQARKAHAAPFLGDHQTHEALGLEECHGVIGDAAGQVGLPRIDHGTQLLAGSIEERLLFGGELAVGLLEQFAEAHLAAENVAVDPDVTGFESLTLGLGDDGQQLVPTHQVHCKL